MIESVAIATKKIMGEVAIKAAGEVLQKIDTSKPLDFSNDSEVAKGTKDAVNQFDTSKAQDYSNDRTDTESASKQEHKGTKEKGEPIQNKVDGLRREEEVEQELKEKYPEEEGYEIISEAYLRDENGNIVKDPETGEARRIDFVVVKDGKVVDSVEVTSKTADKTEQTAKENRIRDNGGNYIKDSNGNLVEIPKDIQTRIERRD